MNEYQRFKEQNSNYKIIYSLRIRLELRKRGFEPLIELINPYKQYLKCWKFLDTEEFEIALSEIMREGKKNG